MGKKRKKRCYCGIGGQAVLEGVMMKNQDSYAVAVRRPDGEIELKKEDYKGIWGDKKITKIPFLRGVFNFIDSLVLGMSTLTWSAQFFEEDEPEKNIADQKKKAKKPEQKEMVSDAVTENVDGKADATDTKEKKSGAAESIAVGGTVALSILMAVAIFIVLPYFLSMLFSHYVLNESLLAIVEGVLRIVIFVAYIAGISAMKDIRRVYMYHGAEHKCINCIERGRELTVKNVRKSSRLHKRCGTSFLLFVMLVSIVLFLFIRVQNPLLRLGLRILLIPVIAGISYELIRLAGRSDNFLVRIISAPGMWLQRLTTKEPDDSMIEVAIASVEAVFDWKAYLKETFGYDVEDWEKQDAAAKAQEAEDAEAADGMEAVMLCRQNPDLYSIIIMDVMMPELDGFSAVKEIRKNCNTPVIMLSARGEEYDKIHGFELGIDDYVVKPFSPKELMMRINAVIKRSSPQTQSNDKVEFEGLAIDYTARIVTVDGEKIDLSPKEYDLLFYMSENKNIALTREMLITNVWGYDFYGDDRTLDTHIKLLRKSLGKYSKFIVTLRGVGYRFEVE